jgi:primosomal protein N' (replication factor Y)
VTGSGKTEVYLHALDHCVASGGRAIVMVPEIALTPQTVRRFRERFERVAVLHSGLTDGEMFDQWHGIAEGRYDVVIGSRSVVFAPQPDLRLIVIDEEHEWTYKQHDAQPRYHARDAAIELARRKGAAVVLGSATPDVVSYERASRGEYTMLALPERIRPVAGADGVARPQASAAMPAIDVVDLREELRGGNRGMFSGALTAAIRAALAADAQVILFLNRRGLAGHVQCRDCGFVPECGSCAVALTYHKQYDRLVCHQCNRHWRLPATCKQCGSPRVRLLGVGVEKVEAEAARAFPHARLLRWDRDVTRGRGAHDRILAAFLAHEADILIGTQMLAKGLDLPAVTLVGVVNADVGLHLPDYRSGERTFQLLTQVAGRAGRGERPGRVIIQTYTPDHYAIEAAARYDYEGFVGAELESRRRMGYPPCGCRSRTRTRGTRATRRCGCSARCRIGAPSWGPMRRWWGRRRRTCRASAGAGAGSYCCAAATRWRWCGTSCCRRTGPWTSIR